MSQELKEQILKGVVTILLFTSVFFAARQAAVLVNEGEAETEERFCVVIDAGHGGDDPGKSESTAHWKKKLIFRLLRS